MKNINLIILYIFLIISNFLFSGLHAQINNKIVVKVGKLIVTSTDIKNEIITNLIVQKQEITQVNINDNKNYAMKNLINKSIKQSEINKYQIKSYSKIDLKNYIEGIAESLNTNTNGLKEIFKQSNVNYESFVEKYKVELLWNTLIFQLYKNQTNVNIIEVNDEVEKIKKNKNKDELKKIKTDILNQKKEMKLNLFSRSHFSKLERTIAINFQ